MATFSILTGKTLATAIAGRAKAVATFTEREHQIAYSALHHVELHSDPKYLNALYEVTPVNYRKGLRAWAGEFGKVKFNDESGAFEYAKGKKSNMEGALAIAPANFAKSSAPKADSEFDEIAFLERALKKLEDKGANPRVIQAMKGTLNVAKAAIVEVIEKPAPKAKAAKAKPAKAAPVATESQEKIAA